MAEFKIRALKLEDAPAINEIRSMRGVAENLLGKPSDRDSVTAALVASLTENIHWFVAVIQLPDGGERVIGSACLEAYTGRRRYVGGIGIMVHPEFQEQGIGRALMSSLLDIADNWLMLERIELDVFTENKRAMKLYESVGFLREGTKRRAAIRSGSFADMYSMARFRP